MNDILTHAAVCRKVAEVYNERHYLYRKPNPGLQGLCGLASHLLFDILQRRGHNPLFVLASHVGITMGSHAWIKVGNLNIDVTATQFESCSPIFNFKGHPEKHPILKKFTRVPWHAFPDNWNVHSFKSQVDIDEAMSGWRFEERYFGIVKKRINDILLTLAAD